jgi:hypothetical protein
MSLVGKTIVAWCTKCKMELAHVVLYEVAGQVSGVKCKTCKSEHRYRGPKPEKQRPSVAAVNLRRLSVAQTVVSDSRTRWMMKNHDLQGDRPIRTYDMRERYGTGDVINHPSFGLGFVEGIVTDHRMNVLFKDAVRYMTMHKEL